MKITDLTLYKTPLSKNAPNVYTFSTTLNPNKLTLKNHLDVLFSEQKISPLFSLTRAFNENKKTTIECTFDNISINNSPISIYEYNYLVITTEFDILFYFITDYRINNSLNSVNYTFFIEWDEWNNNIEFLTKPFTANVQRQTVGGFILGEENGTLYPKCYNTDEPFVPTYTRQYREKNFKKSNFISDKYSIMYQRFIWDNDAVIKNRNGQTPHYLNNPNLHPLKVTYHPLAVVDRVTGKVIESVSTCTFQWNDKQDNDKNVYSSYDLLYKQEGRCLTPNSAHLLYSDITYNAPFRPIFDQSGEPYPPLFMSSSGNTYGYVDLGYTGQEFHKNLLGLVGSLYAQYEDDDHSFIIDNFETVYPHSNFNNEMAIMEQCSRIQTYPYCYKQITIGKENIPLIPEQAVPQLGSSIQPLSKTQIDINYNNSLVTKVKIKSYGKSDELFEEMYDNNVYTLYKNYGQCLFVTDLLEQFLRENENVQNTNMILKSISGGINSVNLANNGANPLNIANSFVGTLSPSLMLGAKIADIENSRDTISAPTSYATDDITRQDNIMFQKVEIKDYRDKLRLAKFFHAFGINIDTITNLINEERVNFGFTQCNNAELTLIPNIEDRKNLENKFNRGIRYYFIDRADINVLKTFDLSMPNKPTLWKQLEEE